MEQRDMVLIIGDNGIEADTTYPYMPKTFHGSKADKTYLYVPRTFDGTEFFGQETLMIDAAHWFLDRLYLYSHFGMRENKFGFTSLKVIYLRQVIPRRVEKIVRLRLQEAGVVECDNCYIEGKKSFGYRLCPKYQVRYKRIQVKDPDIEARIRKLRKADLQKLSEVSRYLFKQFDRLTIDPQAKEIVASDERWSDFGQMALDQLANKQWTPIVCSYGRFHTPITRLLTEYRQFIRLDGNQTVNIDIANSQPLCLALLFLRVISKNFSNEFVHQVETRELANAVSQYSPSYKGSYTMAEVNNRREFREDVTRYVTLTENGELYDYLAENSPLTRKEFKATLFKDVFYGQNYINTELTKTFQKLFPSVMEFIRRIKRGNYARLSWIMQREESRIMIDGVCGRLMRECPDMPVLTIHDSIVTTPEFEDVARDIIQQEFRTVGLTPTLHTESYVDGGV
jgi:hypothetical protein